MQLRAEGRTYPEIASLLGEKYQQVFHEEQLRGLYRRRVKAQKISKDRVTFTNRKIVLEEDMDALFDAMLALQDATDNIDTRQVEATIELDDDKPVGLAHWADWHLGSRGVDYHRFKHDKQLILSTEGLYTVGQGDYGDHALTAASPSGARNEDLVSMTPQEKLVLRVMEEMNSKMLAVCAGCHDYWLYLSSGLDFIAECAKRANAVNLWHGGTLTIKLASQTYTAHIRHKAKYESSLNTSNALRRMFEIYGEADIAAAAHTHSPETSQRHIMGKDRVMVRAGSYKVWDDFGQRIAVGKGRPGVPVVILYPDQHKMVEHLDLETGIQHLSALREDSRTRRLA